MNAGPRLLPAAFAYSFPVFLGYITLGTAFGLLAVSAGYPWWVALLTSLVMYAGAGQFAAVGLFAAGAGLAECLLLELVINARHMAYGLTMFKRFKNAGLYKWYLIFSLSDETFALLSSLPEPAAGTGKNSGQPAPGFSGGPEASPRFMLLVSLLDQLYWVAGTLIGAVAGSLIPFNTEGIGFALTALFTVLMIEQIRRVKSPALFLGAAAAAALAVIFLPPKVALLGAMLGALVLTRGCHKSGA
ncbi:MAG: AzlC family ABC transporter permease [Treponema sp.]|jgi:predicted branched-subunit amino acid permease|nr:AzlC family ABC transporter permease [Treponema sp.]